MGYTDGLMVMFIMGSGEKISKTDKDIKDGLLVMNITENGRITSSGEKGSKKRRDSYS